MNVARFGTGALERIIFGRTPEKSLDDMTVEDLEARLLVKQERQPLLWWGCFAGGFGGSAFAGLKLVALAAKALAVKAAPIVAAAL